MSRSPWQERDPLDRDDFETLRRRMMLEFFKWDPQVEDIAALLPTPLVLEPQAWEELTTSAQNLYDETLAAESEILGQPNLLRRLGLPRVLRRCLGQDGPPAQAAARVMRFDFHFTDEGWRISEVNADVPGGFIEASAFARLMAQQSPHARPPGDPSAALAAALGSRLFVGATVALVYATAYADDAQVMHHLAAEFQQQGLRTAHLGPDHPDVARCDAIVRFFPAEWLVNLPRSSGWKRYFTPQMPPQCNPPSALIAQCKSFPLVWDMLQTAVPTWRRCLPPTFAAPRPHRIDWERWVVKPILGRVGEAVGIAGVSADSEIKLLQRSMRWGGRRDFVLQQRFRAVPWNTAHGPLYPCIGVFVVDGVACGAYGRAALRPLIDHQSHEVAVLVAGPSAVPIHAPAGAGVDAWA